LIEIPLEKPMAALKGVAMELEDCAFPTLAGMVLTSDLQVGFKDVNWALRVAVVGNPCNTNALIAMHAAKGVPRERFTAMTRLDQNRAQSQLALKAGVHSSAVTHTLIWGNHSATQVPDFFHARINGKPAN